MTPLVGKVLLISIPVAGALGTGTYFGFVRSSVEVETIRSKLEQKNRNKSRVILHSASDKIWNKFKDLYKNSESSKKIVGVDENELPNWCEVNLRKTYSEEENSTLGYASSWCVANTNTLKLELEENGFKFIAHDANATSWQNAWNKYNGDKEGLEIESLKTPPSNGATDGGPKLQQWCKSKLDRHMYESMSDEEKTVDKVKKHCVIARDAA